MPYQLSSIVTKVKQRVNDTGYSSSEIINYINDTQNDAFNEYRLPLMKTSQSYTVTTGVADITNGAGLPATYVEAISLRDTTTGQAQEIQFIDEGDLADLYADYDTQTNGQPRYAYFSAGTIKLFPAPAGAYTLKLRYYKKPTTLEADADVPEVPSEFEEMLVAGAAYRVLQAKQAYDEAGILENKYAELLQKFYDKYMRAPASGPARMKINRTGSPYASNYVDSWHRIP